VADYNNTVMASGFRLQTLKGCDSTFEENVHILIFSTNETTNMH